MTAPRTLLATAFAAAALLLTTACSQDGPPEPMTGTLTYSKGSVPPPSHHKFNLEVTPDEFTLIWSGYDGEVGRVTGTPLDLPGALTILEDAGLLTDDCDDGGGGVGGPTAKLDLTIDGESVQPDVSSCKGGPADVLAAIEAIAGAHTVSAAINEVERATR